MERKQTKSNKPERLSSMGEQGMGEYHIPPLKDL